MQKTFKNQQGREFLLLVVEQSAYDFKLNYCNDRVLYQDDECEAPFPPSKIIPKGNYQILCLAKDIDADKLLELGLAEKIGLSWNLKTIYSKVPNTDFEKAATTSYKESLTSLLTSLSFKQDDNVIILEKI